MLSSTCRPGGDAWENLIEIKVMGSRKGGVNRGRGAAARMDTASTRRYLMDQYVEANGGSTVTLDK